MEEMSPPINAIICTVPNISNLKSGWHCVFSQIYYNGIAPAENVDAMNNLFDYIFNKITVQSTGGPPWECPTFVSSYPQGDVDISLHLSVIVDNNHHE